MQATKYKILINTYIFTATILLLDSVHNFPGTEFLRLFKYVLILLLIIDFLFGPDYRLSKTSIIIIGGLLVHTIVFTVFIINYRVENLTKSHLREMVIFLALVFFLVEAIEKYNCMYDFLKSTCLAYFIFLWWAGLTHFQDFVNPIYYPVVFVKEERIRSTFGASQYNYMGYYCFVAIVFFVSYYIETKKRRIITKAERIVYVGTLVWTFLMLMSTGSRSSIISIILFLVLYYYRNKAGRISERTKKIIVLIIIIIALAVLMRNWNYLWNNSNREGNVSGNWPIITENASLWTGLGYIESSAFQIKAYGYNTFPVDIYYVYIFFSTGYIGCAIVFPVLLYLFVRLYKSKNGLSYQIGIPAYCAVLFDAFFQVNIFTYRYSPCIFFSTFLIAMASMGQGKRQKNKMSI